MSPLTANEKAQVDELVHQWLAIDVDETLRKQVEDLHKNGKYEVLKSKLMPRIAFGTAGLRSSMEPGFAHMNDVTILQASQGLVSYIVGQNPGKVASIVVGHDHRYHSQRFAEITASVAITKGVTVYYLGSVDLLSEETTGKSNTKPLFVHTPMVPFGIDHYGASAGVMVTASHNPAKDNGYKVYYGNGCQIIPPHDTEIAHSIEENLEPWHLENVWDVATNFAAAVARGQLQPVKAKLTQLYIDSIVEKLVRSPQVSYNFVYTPMHGVGGEIFSQVCAKLSVKYEIVAQQAIPDPDFPTVKFPNPEEAGALDLAISHAQKTGCQLVMAHDPDADRFSVAVETNSGKWQQLTGNEIGILFAAYVVEELVDPEDMGKMYLINSTVLSQLLRLMAEQRGCHFQDTLTGFKWIGNKAIDLKQQGFHVPFGYEEAIGYMFGPVNDKDGVSASVMWMQLYQQWFARSQLDPLQKLQQIYATYGWHKECNGYYKLDDLKKTAHIFTKTIRAGYDATRDHPRTLGDFVVTEWRDLTVGYESSSSDRKPVLPTDSTSQMITAVLRLPNSQSDEKVRFTCRGSGTEPKLKVYIEGVSRTSEEIAVMLAQKCWATLRDLWFKPVENGLQEVV